MPNICYYDFYKAKGSPENIGANERRIRLYLAHWGLQRQPFENTLDLRFLYLSSQHEEALSRLSYVIESRKEAAVLTGEVGCGKSLLCRTLMHKLSEENYTVGFIPNPQYSALEFLQALLFSLGERELPEKKLPLLVALQKKLGEEAEKGKHCVAVIDEAHLMSATTLEEARLLLNYQFPDRIIFTLILVGQPELKDLVEQNRPLDQRVFLKYHLFPLALEETAAYMTFRLKQAGLLENVFSPTAIEQIAAVTGGIPRRINTVCDLCLLAGYGAGVKQINADVVNAVVT
ncbi:MAG: AAA family ATPase [Deltaproteobacteria bacterium]|nr:AAA family ATPase [Deltaproteobacteria bacterium]